MNNTIKLLPAIVIVAFNRPKALDRLLKSIEGSKYDLMDIPLVISIDGGTSDEVVKIANDFEWKFGEKELITHEKNLGLREHILQCGDLTEKFGSIIMLEEDCFVSPNFYYYGKHALDFYECDENVSGIALYSYSFNEGAQMPFNPFNDGKDVYFMQVPSSWGQAWTKKQWMAFKKYYNEAPNILHGDRLPVNVKRWPESSWKKYFFKFVIDKNKFIVYPKISLTTNFGDIGTHYGKTTEKLQVPLDFRTNGYSFISFDEAMVKYDAYFEILPELIGLPPNTIMDLFGTKELDLFDGEYVYSIKDCVNPIKTFGYQLKDNFLNIKYEIPGCVIKYGEKKDFKVVESSVKKDLMQKMNELIYESGFSDGEKEGYVRGRDFIKSSKPYKLGNLLLLPLKKLFSRK